jgi:cobalt-zinc-cadmium efflux system membrane fusion protein
MRARVSGLKSKLQLMNINVMRLEKLELFKVCYTIFAINGYVTAVNTNIGAVQSAKTDVLFRVPIQVSVVD